MDKKQEKCDCAECDNCGCENECGEELETIKEKYEEAKSKHNLPNFEQMNDDFDISKIECDTETILRDVRKAIISKFSSWLTFIETLINPSGGTMFHMYLVKSIGEKERKILSEIFSELGEIEIQAIELEIQYDEKKEAEFVNINFKKWQEMKKPLLEITGSLKDNWKKETIKKEKSYFG